MNARIAVAVLAALLAAAPSRAEDKPAPTTKESIMTFFKHLKDSLSQSAVQAERKRGRVGAVAAVRGADQSSSLADPNEPALKGDLRAKKAKLAAAEDAEFAKAVDLVLAGKPDEGVKALEEFKSKHPKSRNLDKVQQAIDEAKTLTSGAADKAAAAPASAAPAAPAKADAAPAAPSKN